MLGAGRTPKRKTQQEKESHLKSNFFDRHLGKGVTPKKRRSRESGPESARLKKEKESRLKRKDGFTAFGRRKTLYTFLAIRACDQRRTTNDEKSRLTKGFLSPAERADHTKKLEPRAPHSGPPGASQAYCVSQRADLKETAHTITQPHGLPCGSGLPVRGAKERVLMP